jgi:hypothetical protein
MRTATDYFLARLVNCMVRVVWSSWGSAVIDHSLLSSPNLCPWWYGEEVLNKHKSRYIPPDDKRLIPLLAGTTMLPA